VKPKAAPLAAAVIRECFAQAIVGHRLALPDDEACEWIAQVLASHPPVGTVNRLPTLGVAEKHARLFLRNLPQARAAVISRFQMFRELNADASDEQNPHFAALVDFELAERAVSALMKRYGAEKMRIITWHDWACWIAVYGNSLLSKPGKWLDVKSAAPLCQFVCKVLGEMGINKDADTVSDVLRLRSGPASREFRSRNKVGKTRSK
jgi:hypothetical protein